MREEFHNSKGDSLVLTDKGIEFVSGDYCYYISYKSIVGFYLYTPALKGDFVGMGDAHGTINIVTSSEFKIRIDIDRKNLSDYFNKVREILKEKIE
jgi:hypothetical protein